MALLLLMFASALILLSSRTSATVQLARDQDDSVCAGMFVTMRCTTTTTSGFLQWSINNAVVYSIDDLVAANSNVTVDGSLFVFDSSTTVSGANVYTSTATLNTSHVSTVQCIDNGGLSQTLPVILEVEDRVIFNETTGGTNLVVRWSAPADAGVCCEQFRVMTSQSSMPIDTMDTSITLNDISTPEQRQSATVSVRCMDQNGTLGPEVVYRPLIAPTTCPTVTPCPSPPTCPPPPPPCLLCLPLWALILIVIVFLFLIAYAIVTTVFTVLYPIEKNKTKDNSSIKDRLELDEKKL